MKEASLFLKADNTPFLSNNVLQGRAPSLSFYTQTAHQSGWEWFGHESEHEFGHWHYLLKPELNHPGRGKGVREDPHTPKAKNHPQPAHAAPPTRRCFTQEFRLQNFYKPESPASVPRSCPAHFSIAEDWAYHTTAVKRGFCSLPLPCKRASSLSAEDQFSVSCFEDNCSTTNSVLNPHLHFLEVLSRLCLWGWWFLSLISVQRCFSCM